MDCTYRLILDKYAKRLITTSSRTRTIYYGGNNKYIMDFSRYFSDMDQKEIDDFFIKGQKKEINATSGARSTSFVFKLFDDYLDSKISEEELVAAYPLLDRKDVNLLNSEKNESYLQIYNKCELKRKQELKELIKIKNNNNSIVKVEGKDDLYIGYPYIQGRFNKDKVVRAPLMLHKVNIVEFGDRVVVSCVGVKILNPVFIMSYLVENELTYTDFLDFEILEDDYLPVVDKIFKNIGIKCDVVDGKLKKMNSLTKAEFKDKYNYKDNCFEILNHMAIGIFPISNKKIYDDIKSLQNELNFNQMLNKFYDKNSEVNVFDEDINDVDEFKLKYITALDYSQKKTLQESLYRNSIIQGPPGTGKSQVICNIAANLLLVGSSVLFCSEKRTATDVIYNRLGKLNSFALLLHDHISEKNYFYESIARAISASKENIDKYRGKTYPFNQNYKITSFFDNAKKYNNIIEGKYKGLTIREIIVNNDKALIYENEISELSKLVEDRNQLELFIYQYENSDEYNNACNFIKELKKEYYLKYGINLKNKKIYDLDNVLKKINSLDNNYEKNVVLEEFIKDAKIKKSLLKKIFNKKEEYSECLRDFLNDTMHDFSVFNKVAFRNKIEEILFDLKFVRGLSNEDIFDNYLIYISKSMYQSIDFDFAKNYTSTYDEKIFEAFKDMELKMEDSIEFISRSCSADLKEKLSNPKYNDLVQKLLGEVNKKRRPPVKVIVEKYFDVLKMIFPIWIMTPDVVSAIIPLKENIFDKVIFDEASQLFIEKAIPSIARSKSVIICGDSKQLRPTLFFESRYDDSEEDLEVELEQESALTENSLLDYATTSNKYYSSMLKYHYRCYYKELINFSNYAFYNGELVFANNIKGRENMPIETINVNGKWDGEKNVIEAKKVVSLVKELLVNRSENQTIGIVTLNVNQRDLILDCFEDECKKDKDFANLYLKERERCDEKTGEDESLFVKNLESVQGDERDIIIFSIAYSKNDREKIGSSLGEIQRQYGENRLNVAISRAKKKIYIIKSFMGNELSINESNKGPSYFKKYLCYADALNEGDENTSKNLLSVLTKNETGIIDCSNLWDKDEVYAFICDKIDPSLYEVKRDVDIGSFVIDFVLYSKNTGNYVLGIDCANEESLNNASEISNDVYKHYYLTNRGWDIKKIWITDWLLDRECCANFLNNL